MLTLTSCIQSPETDVDPQSHYQTYCGSCHLVPDPAQIPKAIWEKRVLPEMAARMGYRYNQFNPTANLSMEESLYIRLSGTYPEKAIIDSSTWQQIHNYIIEMAPDSIPKDSLRGKRADLLNQFKPTNISLDEKNLVSVTNIQYDSSTHQFIIGDVYGRNYKWPDSSDTLRRFSSPVLSFHQNKEASFIAEVGYMHPSQKPRGTMYQLQADKLDTLAVDLHRPVFTEIVDLNEDGIDEILICEFGNLTGELSMLVKTGEKYDQKNLLPVPGTIKVEIADMDNDGNKDIVVLASQGNEGIYILYQQDDLQFKSQQVIQLSSVYGLSWFQLIDYNRDNHLDIVTANGDNADYSNFLKPYHGVRLFMNNGTNAFEQKWFYPIYGATRILCEDYDLDGDLDFAVMSFFPDFEDAQDEGFVWLENKNAAQYQFVPHTTPKARSGRWMVMDKGDFDEDGDVDLLLGSFLLQLNREKFSDVIEHWRTEKTDLLLLENQAIP
jgi:hypothetical protein